MVCEYCKKDVEGSELVLMYHTNSGACKTCLSKCEKCGVQINPLIVAWQGLRLCPTHYDEWCVESRKSIEKGKTTDKHLSESSLEDIFGIEIEKKSSLEKTSSIPSHFQKKDIKSKFIVYLPLRTGLNARA